MPFRHSSGPVSNRTNRNFDQPADKPWYMLSTSEYRHLSSDDKTAYNEAHDRWTHARNELYRNGDSNTRLKERIDELESTIEELRRDIRVLERHSKIEKSIDGY